MSDLIKLDQQHLEALNNYHEAVAQSDRSAMEFYGRELDRLDREIEIAGAEIDYYDDDGWD